MRVTKAQDRLDSLIGGCSRAVVFAHENPDGDAIGSAVALCSYLSMLGKEVCAVMCSHLPAHFDFMIPQGKVFYYCDEPSLCEALIDEADLLVFLDMNGKNRSGDLQQAIGRSKAGCILIDHHLNPQTCDFDVVISDAEVSSACELLYQVLLEQPEVGGDVSRLPLDCATALMTGILTDTNNFANSLFPSTYLAVSALQGRGVDRDAIYNRVFCNYSERRMRLMGHLLHDNMRCLECGAAYFILSKADKERYSFVKGDSEGFVNLPLAIAGVRLTALFTEDDGFVKVSLRSKENVDVNEFSHKYCNGGGHKNASGGRLYMPLDAIPAFFEEKVTEFLNK